MWRQQYVAFHCVFFGAIHWPEASFNYVLIKTKHTIQKPCTHYENFAYNSRHPKHSVAFILAHVEQQVDAIWMILLKNNKQEIHIALCSIAYHTQIYLLSSGVVFHINCDVSYFCALCFLFFRFRGCLVFNGKIILNESA